MYRYESYLRNVPLTPSRFCQDMLTEPEKFGVLGKAAMGESGARTQSLCRLLHFAGEQLAAKKYSGRHGPEHVFQEPNRSVVSESRGGGSVYLCSYVQCSSVFSKPAYRGFFQGAMEICFWQGSTDLVLRCRISSTLV